MIGNEKVEATCLRSDHPFPPRKLGLSYFELRVDAMDPDGAKRPAPTVTIGMCGEFCDLRDTHPGWYTWSVGYNAVARCLTEAGTSRFNQGWKAVFGPGYTVGCGVDYDASKYVFTLDGEVVNTFPNFVQTTGLTLTCGASYADICNVPRSGSQTI